MSWPFAFWGRAPSDWLEGANDGHTYEVRFVKEPTKEERAAIGAAFHAAMKKGPATASADDWLWAGPWTIFRVGEKRSGTARAVFDHMETVLRAMHEAAAIAEVVFWGARAEGSHAWDAWTRENAKAPTSGPQWKGYSAVSLYGGSRNATLGQGASDGAFELARTGRKAKKGSSAEPGLKVASVLPGVSGWPKKTDDVEVKAQLAGALRAARKGPSESVVALTTEGLFLIANGRIVKELPPKGAVQLAVTESGAMAVTMTPNDEVYAYKVTPSGLDPVGETTVKKGGILWAKGERVFFSSGGSSYFEVTLP
jgi:hypothetical protein